jgi:hypothetical protein
MGETAEGQIIATVENRKNKRADIAKLYYQVLIEWNGGEEPNWRLINEAILSRWSFSGLEWIKAQAWKQIDAVKLKG